jgi:hypothetical protein
MLDSIDYAIIDAGDGSSTAGKILVLVDDEQTAVEMARHLRRRGCDVVVRRAVRGQELVLQPSGDADALMPVHTLNHSA